MDCGSTVPQRQWSIPCGGIWGKSKLCSVRSSSAETGHDCLGLGNLTLYRKIKEQGNKSGVPELAWHLGWVDWIYCISGQAQHL